jgi:transposase
MRRIHLATHLSVDELEQRYRAAHEPHERTWWQILWLLARGQLAKDIAESTGYTRTWIGQIAKRYNAEGPDGMVNRQHTTSWRAPRMLSAEQQEELRAALAGPAPDGAKHWSCRAVAAWMAEKLGRPVAVQRGWEYLHRLQQSRQVPRPRHALADAEQQADFKKKSARSSAPSRRPTRRRRSNSGPPTNIASA